ncbi:MAG: YegS/Rv2252/BmrU family lipid kinase, partial [Actinobacteria bacterium]|nr:YegS/Rv2252/BmrU family lipid kinase [Actinomycetota bacterium]
MKNLIILNPASFRGKTVERKEELEELLKKLGMNYKIHISKGTDDITQTVRKNIDNFTNFISFGGDGTLHYIANVLAGTDKNVGCIPMGSGNDIARNMQIPMDIEKCCLILKNPKIKKIDLGLINRKYYYLAISGTGFDSVVNDLANNTKFPLKGPAKYKYAVYKTLITFRSKTFSFKYDGNERNLDAMMLAVGNMTTYGGGMRITPEADPTDGILDLCIIKR